MLSRIVTSIARRGSTRTALSLSSAYTRQVSNSSGIDKYFTPYPTLPKIETKDSSSPPHVTPLSPAQPDSPSAIFNGLLSYSSLVPERTASDRWISVHDGLLREPQGPGNVYTGRSVPVTESIDVSSAYRRLHSILNRNRVRSELYLQRRYEKPSDRERRLKSERHRRRFAAWVSWKSSREGGNY
jgi:ribosomal protein S21